MTVPLHPVLSCDIARAAVRAVALLVVALVVALAPAGIASAHTDFESSAPADGEVVDGSLSTVSLRFTNPAEPVDEGFELLDPDGTIRTPDTIETAEDGRVFVLGFEPALGAGAYGLRWQVRAGDAHPIDGAFSFTVEVAVPVDTTGTTAINSEPAAIDDDDVGAGAAPSLGEFLATDESGGGVAAGRLGRLLTFMGTVFGVGALAVLAWVLRGGRDEVRGVLGWARLAGLAVVTGGVVELASAQSSIGLGLGDLLTTDPGRAIALKIAGGTAVVLGLPGGAGRIVPPALSAATATLPDSMPAAAVDGHRWAPSATAAVGLAGYAAVVASFWFDGHTVSRGPWFFHGITNLVHVVAAAVWAGGVMTLAIVAIGRRRAERSIGLAAMFLRFSAIATVALIAVLGAGLAMTILVIEEVNDIWSTEWGRLWLAKVAVVGVAIAIGTYNHVRLRPELARSGDGADLADRIRTTLVAEAVVFVAVVAVTAWLVAAAI